MEARRIVVIGISGTGKTKIGRKIGQLTGIPVSHMDSIIWDRNWQESDPAEISKNLSRIVNSPQWVVEGWIDNYSKELLRQADIVYYLDYPGWLAMLGGLQRWWQHRGTRRPELPEGCVEAFGLKQLRVMLQRRERPHIEKLVAEVKPKSIIRCTSRAQIESELRKLVIA